MEKISCPYCKQKFDTPDSLKQHTDAKHKDEPQKRQKTKIRKFAVLALAALIILGLGFGAFKAISAIANKEPKLPYGEDHWHAKYSVEICGERQEDLPYSTDIGIHTHGDGLIHTHPHGNPEAEGLNANLERFFLSSNITLTNDTIVWKGTEYKTGETECPDGNVGTLMIYNKGKPVDSKYVVRDGDAIKFIFE